VTLFARDLACQQAIELVTDYLEGRLGRRDRKRLERHLAGCPNCSRYLEQMRQTIRLAGAVAPETLEPAARQDLMALYQRYTQRPDSPTEP
jgi:anti-sigma factor RsiW